MHNTIIVKPHDLGLYASVNFSVIENSGYSHEELVAAFKAKDFGPVALAEDIFREVFAGFRGYIPDEKFFLDEKPRCLLVQDGDSIELVYDDHIVKYERWPTMSVWLLQKK